MRFLLVSFASAAALILSGCAQYSPQSSQPYPAYGQYPNSSYNYSNASSYGVVTAVRAVQQPASTTGAGTVIGGLAGGLLGHQVGRGSGNTAATIDGAVGGALVGNQIEKNQAAAASQVVYQIDLHMDDGSYQTVTTPDGSFQVGQRIIIQNGQLLHD